MKKFLSVLLVVMMLAGCIVPSIVANAGDLAVISVPVEGTGLEGDTGYKTAVSLTDTPADPIYLQMVVYWSADAPVDDLLVNYDAEKFTGNSGITAGPLAGNNRNMKTYTAAFGANTADYMAAVVDIEGNDVFGTGTLCDLEFVFSEAMAANAEFEYSIGLYVVVDENDEEIAWAEDPIDVTVTFEPDPYMGLYEEPTLFLVSDYDVVEPGDQVTVDVRIDANPGINTGLYVLVYPEEWTIESSECGNVFIPSNYTPGSPNLSVAENTAYLKDRLACYPETPLEGTSYITAMFQLDDPLDVNENNGILASYVFNVPENAAPASSADLTVIYDKEGDIIKADAPGEFTYWDLDVVGKTFTIAGVCYHEDIREIIVTEPTCTENGEKNVICTACGGFLETDVEIPALGHDWDEGVVNTAATCTADGVMFYTCTRCLETRTEAIPMIGHDWDEGEIIAPTCEAGGYTTYTCSRCEDTYTTDETEAFGHDYVSNVIEPTCIEGGYTTYVCSRCNDTYVADEIEALGHDYVNDVCTRCNCNIYGIMQGDVDGDGKITSKDMNLLKQITLGSADNVLAADVNCDGKITAADVNLLKMIISGITA